VEEKDFSFKLIFSLQCYESQLQLLNEKQERKLYIFMQTQGKRKTKLH